MNHHKKIKGLQARNSGLKYSQMIARYSVVDVQSMIETKRDITGHVRRKDVVMLRRGRNEREFNENQGYAIPGDENSTS